MIYEPTERANPTQMLSHAYLAELMLPINVAASASTPGLKTPTGAGQPATGAVTTGAGVVIGDGSTSTPGGGGKVR